VELAYKLMCREPRAFFVFVGSGPTQESVQSKIRQMGLASRVEILPPRPDIPKLMLGAFDYFVFPSLYEGLGLALIEAQAAGLPCFVSTDVPEEATVVPALVSRIPLAAGADVWAATILESLSRRPGLTQQHALETILERFDIHRNAAELLAFYRRSLYHRHLGRPDAA
jgi:glycosyltransferase involved in cell wall biosynthesis